MGGRDDLELSVIGNSADQEDIEDIILDDLQVEFASLLSSDFYVRWSFDVLFSVNFPEDNLELAYLFKKL